LKGIEGSKVGREKLVIFKDKTLKLTSVPNGDFKGFKDDIKMKRLR